MLLPSRPDCQDCELYTYATHPGHCSREWDGGNQGHPKAVLIISKAPAVREDEAGQCFVDAAGKILSGVYVEGAGLQKLADIYYTNAVRCRLPNPRMAIPQSAIKACREHWVHDVKLLDAQYTEVVILAAGAEALTSVLGRGNSLTKFRQGTQVEVAGTQRTVFATYNPAMLEQRRDPSKGHAVEAHLALLQEYLRDGELRTEVDITTRDVDYKTRVPADCGLVSLDIETYGCCEGYPRQRFFHPRKSTSHDHVAPSDLVLTAAAAWRDEFGTLRHCCWDLTTLSGRGHFLTDFQHLGRAGATILGQNIPFDIMFLRAWSGGFAAISNPFNTNFKLMDLAVLNFLECDQRPERSLKNLSPLLSTASYDERVNLRAGERYPCPHNPELHAYNVLDAVVTLRNYEILKARLPRKFGATTAKGTPYCLDWYSKLLWLAISMMEQGIEYDTEDLGKLATKLERRLKGITEWAERFGAVLLGKGSKKYADALAGRAVDELKLYNDKRVKLTDITKAVSSAKENMNLFMGEAQRGSPLHLELRTLRRFREHRKILTSSLRPLLALTERDRDLNNSLVDGKAYPTWYIVPMAHESEEGGTQQGRITAKGPAVQTHSPMVENTERSRYEGGALVSIDMAQIEYRVPAMYSGDKQLLKVFRDGINIHAATASEIMGFPVTKKSHPHAYHLGKTTNFLIAFRGQAAGLQQTAQRELGLDLSLSRCEEMIRKVRHAYPDYIAWQDELIATAKRQGYLEIPLLGLSRTFLGSPAVIDKTYVPTIVNFPVQTTAALLVLDAQIATEKWLRASGLRSRLIKNTYDEGVYDCPRCEIETVAEALPGLYREPDLYLKLVHDANLHQVPLDCSLEIRYTDR